MKRYSVKVDMSDGTISWPENEHGYWVKAEDVDKLRAVVDALPRCDYCGSPATHQTEHVAGVFYCDRHADYIATRVLPYADALRALLLETDGN